MTEGRAPRARTHLHASLACATSARVDDPRTRANAAMTRYACGDDSAFSELYTLLAPQLFRLCIHLVGRVDAEELLQEVFLKMHRARASFTPGASVSAWCYAIARTTCVDRARRKQRRPESAMEREQLEAQVDPGASCPESTSAGRALEGVLHTRLAGLSDTLRRAYMLVKVEGLSCAEAADLLGTSPSAVKQRIHRVSDELKLGMSEAGW
jgi:RNA polymerase sigma-70 factor (ECF subfamily)